MVMVATVPKTLCISSSAGFRIRDGRHVGNPKPWGKLYPNPNPTVIFCHSDKMNLLANVCWGRDTASEWMKCVLEHFLEDRSHYDDALLRGVVLKDHEISVFVDCRTCVCLRAARKLLTSVLSSHVILLLVLALGHRAPRTFKNGPLQRTLILLYSI